MDIFDFDNVKTEKAYAMRRYRLLRTLAKLFRLVELFLALLFFSWISSQLPLAVKISGEYFRHVLTIIVSPLFIFLLSNFIVLTLLAKSRQSLSVNNVTTDLYEQILTNNENSIVFDIENDSPVLEPEEIVYDDKQILCEVMSTKTTDENEVNHKSITDPKVYRRSQSENLTKDCTEKACGKKLRRSETEIDRKIDDAPVNIVDELSNEEFQRRIEGFIAKQVKFHQEEKLSIVLHNQSQS